MKRQFFDLKPGETLVIGNSRITAQPKSGKASRFMVESDEPTQRGDSLPHPNSAPPASILKRPGQ